MHTTTDSVSHAQSSGILPVAPSHSPLHPDAVDAVTRLVEAAEALARMRILTRPCAVTSAGTVRDSEVCTQCQRARTSAAGFQHAATCVVGHVMAACDLLRGSGSLTVFSEAYARGWSDGQRRAIEQITGAQADAARRLRPSVQEKAQASRRLEAVTPPAIPLTEERARQIQREWDAAARRPEVVESDESWEASAALNRDRRVVCGRAIPVFGFAGKDVFTCDLAPGHGDAWHNDRTVNKIWVADATEIHFHANGAVETRLLGGVEEFDFSNAICTWCGPTCYSGAAHNARVEADDRWNDQPSDREARGSAGVAR